MSASSTEMRFSGSTTSILQSRSRAWLAAPFETRRHEMKEMNNHDAVDSNAGAYRISCNNVNNIDKVRRATINEDPSERRQQLGNIDKDLDC